jgi:1-acyl-sn-glycerol-3-phosphate acyltransferase
MNVRFARRTVTLGLVLIGTILRFWLMRLGGPRTLERRALWLQKSCRHVLWAMDIRVHVSGRIPKRGLVVSNHLSYLDIAILSAVMPCFFVAKAEIDRWPYFGRAARSGGTLFLDRSSMASARKVAVLIRERLTLPVSVLLFPEGTSTDGSSVLRFHARLFEPAIIARAPVTAAAIRYEIEDGTPERELCWYGDQTFVPHMIKTLRSAGFTAELQFGEPHVYPRRRIAADAAHAEIEAMRAASFAADREKQLQPA